MDYAHFWVEPGQKFENGDGSFVITVDHVDHVYRGSSTTSALGCLSLYLL